MLLFVSVSRSTRGGSRPTSLKLKAHPAMKENGDINPHATLMGVRRMDDLDIKDIQQKKQQAEQKRFIFNIIANILFHN